MSNSLCAWQKRKMAGFSRADIIVVGDFIEDVYHWGKVTRICPEAPVPVFVQDKAEIREGGAGLVLNQCIACGASADGWYLSESAKHRYMVGKQMLLRVDRDSYNVTPPNNEEEAMWAAVEKNAKAIIISDYNKGGVTLKLAKELIETGTPVFVDAKCPHPHMKYKGAFCIFPNENEKDSNEQWSDIKHVIQKLGAQGCTVDDVLVKTEPQQVYDVTGAGDVFIAAFVSRWVRNLTDSKRKLWSKDIGEQMVLIDAAEYANKIAGESVKHLGTHVVDDLENENS